MKKFLQLITTALITIPMVASAHGPTRQQVVEKITINAAPEKVWTMIKDFGGLHNWHPAIQSTELTDDKTRVLTLNADDNSTITEELIKSNDEKMMLNYKIIDMSTKKTISFNSKDFHYKTLPISTYKSWITVTGKNGGSEVTWKGKFYRAFMDNPPVPEGQSDADAVNAVTGVYTTGLENLKAIMENK